MFGLGTGEILLIVIALIVLLAMGKLPDVARKAGGAYRTYRKAESEVRSYADPSKIINIIATDKQPPPKARAAGDNKKETT